VIDAQRQAIASPTRSRQFRTAYAVYLPYDESLITRGFRIRAARGRPCGRRCRDSISGRDAGRSPRIDPSLPVFARDASWNDLFDELREGRPPKRRQLAEWRAKRPLRAIAFHPVILPDGRDADGIVHVHLEHRLVRRLLSRFVSHGFQAGLNRAAAIYGPGSQPRVVLVGRLALFGSAAARLHEEILPVTALWSETARSGQGLRAFGQRGEQTCRHLAEIEDSTNIRNHFLQMAEHYSSRANAEEPDTPDHANGG
jgi:hypothetical protein